MRLTLAEWAGAVGEAVGLIFFGGGNPDGFMSHHELRLDHRLNSSELHEYEHSQRLVCHGRRIISLNVSFAARRKLMTCEFVPRRRSSE